jgi:hypothetical protein
MAEIKLILQPKKTGIATNMASLGLERVPVGYLMQKPCLKKIIKDARLGAL